MDAPKWVVNEIGGAAYLYRLVGSIGVEGEGSGEAGRVLAGGLPSGATTARAKARGIVAPVVDVKVGGSARVLPAAKKGGNGAEHGPNTD